MRPLCPYRVAAAGAAAGEVVAWVEGAVWVGAPRSNPTPPLPHPYPPPYPQPRRQASPGDIEDLRGPALKRFSVRAQEHMQRTILTLTLTSAAYPNPNPNPKQEHMQRIMPRDGPQHSERHTPAPCPNPNPQP